MIESMFHELNSPKNKSLLFEAATYSLMGIMVLAGVIGLPYNLWIVLFHNGSFSRIVALVILCVAAGYGVRSVDYFKKRVHYIDSLRAFGYSDGDAIRAWKYYVMGKYDPLSVERAKRTKRQPPPSATPRPRQRPRR